MSSDLPAIPITVIGGYLGAGKTTLVNALLRNAQRRRIGVVVNDFGELGIDAELITAEVGDIAGGRGSDERFPVVNLANGCVCCSLGDDLRSTLEILASVSPPLDHIVIEASGVADPAATAAWGSVAPFVPGGIVVLAGADQIRDQVNDRYVAGEVRRQLACADLLILTKLDRCSVAQADEVTAWLGDFTSAPIVAVEFGAIDIDIVLEPRLVKPDHAAEAETSEESPGHTQDLVRWSFESDGTISRVALDAFLAGLPDGLLRCKGFVACPGGDHLVIQVVGETVDVVVRAGWRSTSQLVAIGIAGRLDTDALERRAVQYLRRA